MDNLEHVVKVKKFRYGSSVYKYQDFLGKGGFGSCYSFTNESNDSIAVKVIEKQKMKLTSMVRESDIHRRLNHENIVRYFSKCEDNGYCYIIMELCGKSLQYLFQESNKMFPILKIQKYGRDILRGIAYLTNQNVVHRDIKLENILISNCDVAKIGDFGLSREVSELEESNRQAFCGSFFYLAPEVITSFGYSSESDIWSFGVILYRLTTGYYPFFGSYDDLFYRIRHIIYHRSVALNMNKNGRRLTQLFYYIFRQREIRLTAIELLNRAFFTKVLVPEDEVDMHINDEVVDSYAIANSLPDNLSKIIDVVLEKLHNTQIIDIDLPEDFIYITSCLDYTNKYGIMYYLNNNICGFWHFDLSTIFYFHGTLYHYKYLNGQRYMLTNKTISHSKQLRFKTFLNELLTSEEQQILINEDKVLMPEPIFIDYWIQTIQYFIIILSNGTIHIDLYRNYRETTGDQYIISGKTGRLYFKFIRNDEFFLRVLSRHARDQFLMENPRILEILSKFVSKK